MKLLEKIDQLISIVPQNQQAREEDFLDVLQGVRNHVEWASPEMERFWKHELTQLLDDLVLSNEEMLPEWQVKLLRIWEKYNA